MAKTRTEIGTSIGSVRVDRPDRHASPQGDYPGLDATAHGDYPCLSGSRRIRATSQANACHATATPHVMSMLVRATSLDYTRHGSATCQAGSGRCLATHLHSVLQSTVTRQIQTCQARATVRYQSAHTPATVHPTTIHNSPARLTRTGHSTVSPDQCDVSRLAQTSRSDNPYPATPPRTLATPQAKSRHNPATPQNGSLRDTPARLAITAFVKSPLGDSTLRHRSSPLLPLRQTSTLPFRTAHSPATRHIVSSRLSATVQASSDNSRSARRAYPSSAHAYATLQNRTGRHPETMSRHATLCFPLATDPHVSAQNKPQRQILSSPGDSPDRHATGQFQSLRLAITSQYRPQRQAAPAHFMSSRRDYPILNVSVPSDVPNHLPPFPHAATEQSTATVHVRPEPVHSDRPQSTSTIPSDGPVQNGSLLFRATSRDKLRQVKSERPSRPGRHAPPLHVSGRRVTSSPYHSHAMARQASGTFVPAKVRGLKHLCDCGHSIPHQDTSDHGDVPRHLRVVSSPSDWSCRVPSRLHVATRRCAPRLSFATDRYGPRSCQHGATSHVCPLHLVTVPRDEPWLPTSRSLLATSHSDKPSQAFLAPVLATCPSCPWHAPATYRYHQRPIPATNRVRSTQIPETSLAPTCPATSRLSDMPRLAISAHVPATSHAMSRPATSQRLPKPSRFRSLRRAYFRVVSARLPMSRLVVSVRLPIPFHADAIPGDYPFRVMSRPCPGDYPWRALTSRAMATYLVQAHPPRTGRLPQPSHVQPRRLVEPFHVQPCQPEATGQVNTSLPGPQRRYERSLSA